MKIHVISTGTTEFTADPDHAEPALRESLAWGGSIGPVIMDCTDGERDTSNDEWVTVTEDDGTPLWSGWLGGVTAPPPADRAALEQLAAAQARITELEAQIADSGAEHPSCDAHRWWAVVQHYGSFAYGFAATQDGLRMWSDVDEFEYAKAQDFE